LRVAAITGGLNEPSSRFRVRQYIPLLAANGISVKEYIPFKSRSDTHWYNDYPLPVQILPQLWATALRVVAKVPAIVGSYQADLTWIQREFLTPVATTEVLTSRPRLFDVDDAIWLRMKATSGFAKWITRRMDGVICGNQWIADYFADCGTPSWVIPTGVDPYYWHPPVAPSSRPFQFGWMGTSGNLRYLYEIEEALATVFAECADARLLVVSDKAPTFSRLPVDRVTYLPWSVGGEAEAMRQMDVGLMPLEDSEWERGKCSFKALTYMATGIPIVVSPVGMNQELLAENNVGLGPNGSDEWVDALVTLYRDDTVRTAMGRAGRQVVESRYSTDVTGRQLIAAFRQIV
jgi:glycosyltransferase involved in cell wall biosynthesis